MNSEKHPIDELSVLRKHMRSLPVDVVAIIEELKILYIEEPLEDKQSGRIDFNDPFCTIHVNSKESEQRKRFTAAHELGHFLLHKDLLAEGRHLDRLFDVEPSDNPSEPLRKKHEVQANQFAADLLMPRSATIRLYQEYEGDVNKIAEKFAVSRAAVEVRLKSLGLS